MDMDNVSYGKPNLTSQAMLQMIRNMHKMHNFLQILHIYRRIVRREAPVVPPKWHFVSAGVPADTAEMTLVRRIARLVPPRVDLPCCCHNRYSKNTTQRHKEAKAQGT